MRIGLSLIFVLMTSLSALASGYLTYHGRILDQHGNPPVGSVVFEIKILSPEGCLLYSEDRTVVFNS
ncbi:MAG: hypothetical protein N2578_03775, partial [Bdellovibrionaceae bacterium]|nr:hypothetical protein [Pseudobdellovibrionaceae bacterium]